MRKDLYPSIADSWFSAFTDLERPNYPPYNLYRTSQKDFVIEVALAGFTKSDVDVFVEPKRNRFEKRMLVIKGTKSKDNTDNVYMVRGIANRQFKLSFTLADDAEIKSAKFEDGLLKIEVSADVKIEAEKISIPIM
jgi:HSP20 family molecular chaperone IbpA